MNANTEYAAVPAGISNSMLNRVRAEYREMPGLSLTQAQMQRLFGFNAGVCETLIDRLVSDGVLRRNSEGCYIAADRAVPSGRERIHGGRATREFPHRVRRSPQPVSQS